MDDATTDHLRARRAAELNSAPRTREALEQAYGPVWSQEEFLRDYILERLYEPLAFVVRRSDGTKGSVLFQHEPRFYFRFIPADTL